MLTLYFTTRRYSYVSIHDYNIILIVHTRYMFIIERDVRTHSLIFKYIAFRKDFGVFNFLSHQTAYFSNQAY